MKGQTYVILSIIFIIIISIFAVLNIDVVEVNYLFWSGSSPLIFVILFSVLLGGILTTVVGSKKYVTLRRENKRLKKELTQLEANTEVDKERLTEGTLMEQKQTDDKTEDNVK